jgi:hypothetical protein
VLCDFIIDKATRLFNKYDTVSKEKKLMQEESQVYFRQKVEDLESENKEAK